MFLGNIFITILSLQIHIHSHFHLWVFNVQVLITFLIVHAGTFTSIIFDAKMLTEGC